jgi:DinB superfamily
MYVAGDPLHNGATGGEAMAHPLVDQLRFTREQWLQDLEGLSEDDATRHFGQMNCISWLVGHTAAQEHRFWFEYAQGVAAAPFPGRRNTRRVRR